MCTISLPLSHPTSGCLLELVPDEVICHVLSFLPHPDRLKCTLVSCHLSHLARTFNAGPVTICVAHPGNARTLINAVEKWGGATGKLNVNLDMLLVCLQPGDETSIELNENIRIFASKIRSLARLDTVTLSSAYISESREYLSQILLTALPQNSLSILLDDGSTAPLATRIFEICTGLKDLIVSGDVRPIEEPAHAVCTNLVSLVMKMRSFRFGTLPPSLFLPLTNLERLEIMDVWVGSLDPLQNCTRLEKLSLEYNPPDGSVLDIDLSVLGNMRSLTHLELFLLGGDVEIRARGMPQLPKLRHVIFHHVTIDTLDWLPHLTALAELQTHIPEGAVIPNLACRNLKVLDLCALNNHPISTFEFLFHCSTLTSLKLSHVHLDGLNAHTTLPSTLKRLELINHSTTEIPSCFFTPSLEICELSCTALTQISPLGVRIPSYLSIRFSENLASLDSLGGSITLTSLHIWDCPRVSSLTPLSFCPNIHTISISDLPHLKDISPLTTCTALTSLTLKSCPGVTTIEGISSLGKLASVTLGGFRSPPTLNFHPLLLCPSLVEIHLAPLSPSTFAEEYRKVKDVLETRKSERQIQTL